MTDATTALRKPARSQWWDVWDQFRSHKGAFWGMVVFLVIVVMVLFGPIFWHIDPTYIDIRARNQGPSLAHPMGTDQLGRDTFARMMAGGRVSLAVGMTAMLLALVLGTLIGVLAGYFKRLDGPLMRLTDLFLALPLLPLLLVIIMLFRETLSARFGPEGGIFILMVSAIGRVRSCGALHRDTEPAHGNAAYPAQCAVAHHGLGHAWHRYRHHHRKLAQLPGPWLPTGFPDMGTVAV